MATVVLAYNETYQLRIYTSENSPLDGRLITFDDIQAAYVSHTAVHEPTPIYFRRAPPELSAPAPNMTFIVVPSPSTPPVSSKANNQYLALQGPSGKSEYRIVALDNPPAVGIGATISYNAWLVKEDGGRKFLRYADDSGGASRWVLSKKWWGWILWWYEPTPANANDLGTYMAVDVEVEEAE
ncbi:hypothetical protein jhhlp_002675 [Lomentospora prolificans]|uniref:Uncharacterized protein n=1 Tax=Lomentospora prolificans TaxID=41688 RepID=A0A2N3NEV0_9PEZI|nr:hypothetical protein jhhlp_002675 [Lomentospora prolificans]